MELSRNSSLCFFSRSFGRHPSLLGLIHTLTPPLLVLTPDQCLLCLALTQALLRAVQGTSPPTPFDPYSVAPPQPLLITLDSRRLRPISQIRVFFADWIFRVRTSAAPRASPFPRVKRSKTAVAPRPEKASACSTSASRSAA